MFLTNIRARIMLVAIVLVLLASACSPQIPSTSPIPTLDSPVPTLDSYPGAAGLAVSAQIPTPESGKGTVVGILNDKSRGTPYSNRFIYLASVNSMKSTTSSDPIYFAELDTATAPYSQTDINGQFLFVNVEPGRYALVEWLPNLEQTLLYDADTNINLSVEVKSGVLVNLGVLGILAPQ
jgi:hypothetical protein